MYTFFLMIRSVNPATPTNTHSTIGIADIPSPVCGLLAEESELIEESELTEEEGADSSEGLSSEEDVSEEDVSEDEDSSLEEDSSEGVSSGNTTANKAS